MAQCRGCGSSRTIRAHIVPAAFGRMIRGSDQDIYRISAEGEKLSKTGIWDPAILCDDCDGKLNWFDAYAISLIRSLAVLDYAPPGGEVCFGGVDKGRLLGFFGAVLWRASITRHEDYAGIDVGLNLEGRLQRALFAPPGSGPWRPPTRSGHPLLDGFMIRLSSANIPVEGFYSVPLEYGLKHHRFFAISLGGFQALIKVDHSPLAPPMSGYSLLAPGPLRTVIMEFEKTLEFEAMLQARIAGLRRER